MHCGLCGVRLGSGAEQCPILRSGLHAAAVIVPTGTCSSERVSVGAVVISSRFCLNMVGFRVTDGGASRGADSPLAIFSRIVSRIVSVVVKLSLLGLCGVLPGREVPVDTTALLGPFHSPHLFLSCRAGIAPRVWTSLQTLQQGENPSSPFRRQCLPSCCSAK